MIVSHSSKVIEIDNIKVKQLNQHFNMEHVMLTPSSNASESSDISSTRITKSRTRRSDVWSFFERVGGRVKCSTCKQEFSGTTSTSSLNKHLSIKGCGGYVNCSLLYHVNCLHSAIDLAQDCNDEDDNQIKLLRG